MIQQEMLQYQTLDSELNRIEKELRKNEFFVKRKQYNALRKDCEENISKLDSTAADLRVQLANARQSMEKISAVIEEHSKEIADIEDKDELNYMNKKLNEQLDLLSAVEKDLKRILREGEEVAKSFDEINAKLPKIIAGYNKCNEEFAKVTELQKPRVTELKVKQAELKKVIDPAQFELYKKISDGQIFPVFVPLLNDCQCGGCRMEMPKAVVDTHMAKKDTMRCEHCGRIIYKR